MHVLSLFVRNTLEYKKNTTQILLLISYLPIWQNLNGKYIHLYSLKSLCLHRYKDSTNKFLQFLLVSSHIKLTHWRHSCSPWSRFELTTSEFYLSYSVGLVKYFSMLYRGPSIQEASEEKIFFRNKDRDEMNNLNRGPSIDASFQLSLHLAKRFLRRKLKCER